MKRIVLLALMLCAPFAVAKDHRSDKHSGHRSGIAGKVVLFHCPVAGPFECPPRPYQASFSVYDEKGRLVKRVEPEEDGFFAVNLKPGNYRIVPDPPEPPEIY